MTAVATVRAQAKINLFLRILAREASGYHALETLFCRLELADDVAVRPTSGSRSIDCRGADPGPAEANLGYRAAMTFADATGWPAGFAIEIEKRIAIGGGLGGGSADAAAVLRALNALAPTPLPGERLLELAGALGADVPFMMLGSPLALAWARGDHMLALPPLASMPVSLMTYPFGVSSADAYGWIAETRRGQDLKAPARAFSVDGLSDWESIAALAGNDFESEVARRHPAIRQSLVAARATGPLIAQLSGSGSTIFVIPRVGQRAVVGAVAPGGAVIETRTAFSVEDVVVTR